MAKANDDFTCTVEFTEGSEQRITEALVDLYYNRQRGLTKTDSGPDDKTT
ncbi:MAG: hypothetical protein J6D08_16655 [Lachnospiraceae bacterium]|nr:hypothetical protein [Lachnospiraceae bacterium]